MQRIVLGYSGGLETSVAIPWLTAHYRANGGTADVHPEVVAVIVDLGRRAGLVELRERALALGAVRCHVIDAREEFVRAHILPALQAGAFADGRSPQVAALARPLVTRKIVEVARMEHADAIAFGGSHRLNRPSIDVLVRSIDPSLHVIAPARLWSMSAPEVAAYAATRSVPTPPPDLAGVKISANVWGRSTVIDPQHASERTSEALFTLTLAPGDAPGEGAYLDVEFEAGVPVRVNGIDMPLLEMIESLETIAGTHGVGRTDTTLTGADGTPHREISESPAAVVLATAHRALLELAVHPDLARLSGVMGQEYAGLIDQGNWFSDMREALDAFSAAIQPKLTGSIRLSLLKGSCDNVGLHSGTSLVRTV